MYGLEKGICVITFPNLLPPNLTISYITRRMILLMIWDINEPAILLFSV